MHGKLEETNDLGHAKTAAFRLTPNHRDSKNRVHTLLSRVVTMTSFAILIPLRRKYFQSYSGKKVTCWTQEKYF
jgi:hypothetical protein